MLSRLRFWGEFRKFRKQLESKPKVDFDVNTAIPYFISPSIIENKVKYCKVDSKYTKTISVTGLPKHIQDGVMRKLIDCPETIDVSIHITPQSRNSVLVDLEKTMRKVKSDLYAQKKLGVENLPLDEKYLSIRSVQKQLLRGEESIFLVTFTILVKADSLKQLNRDVKKVKSLLSSMQFACEDLNYMHQQGLQAVYPVGADKVPRKPHNLTTSALAALIPFVNNFSSIDNTGVLVGFNKSNLNPIIKDIYKLNNYSGIVLGLSGSGKSYWVKLYMTGLLMNKSVERIYIIDPQAEYHSIVKQLGGEIIEISESSKSIINPLDMGLVLHVDKESEKINFFNTKLNSLMRWFDIICEGTLKTSPQQKAILSQAIIKTYEKKGITKTDRNSWFRKEQPILQDLIDTLKEMMNEGIKTEKLLKRSYESLISKLLPYSKKGMYSFLNNQTKIDYSKNIICFDTRFMTGNLRDIMTYLVVEFIVSQMCRDRTRKMLFVDEGWSAMDAMGDALNIMVRTLRKFGGGLFLVSQDATVLLNSKSGAGEALINNTGFVMMFRQGLIEVPVLTKNFGLPKYAKERLATLNRGEAFFKFENDLFHVQVHASDKMHELVTTNPDELNKKTEDTHSEYDLIIENLKTAKITESERTELIKLVTTAKRMEINPNTETEELLKGWEKTYDELLNKEKFKEKKTLQEINKYIKNEIKQIREFQGKISKEQEKTEKTINKFFQYIKDEADIDPSFKPKITHPEAGNKPDEWKRAIQRYQRFAEEICDTFDLIEKHYQLSKVRNSKEKPLPKEFHQFSDKKKEIALQLEGIEDVSNYSKRFYNQPQHKKILDKHTSKLVKQEERVNRQEQQKQLQEKSEQIWKEHKGNTLKGLKKSCNFYYAKQLEPKQVALLKEMGFKELVTTDCRGKPRIQFIIKNDNPKESDKHLVWKFDLYNSINGKNLIKKEVESGKKLGLKPDIQLIVDTKKGKNSIAIEIETTKKNDSFLTSKMNHLKESFDKIIITRPRDTEEQNRTYFNKIREVLGDQGQLLSQQQTLKYVQNVLSE